MEHTIKLSQEDLEVILHALGELQLKISGPVFSRLQAQLFLANKQNEQ